MTTMSIGKFIPALKLKLGTKAVICAILLIAVNTALVVGAAYWSLSSEFNQRAFREIEVNLRTLALAFNESFPEAKISDQQRRGQQGRDRQDAGVQGPRDRRSRGVLRRRQRHAVCL